MTAAPDPGGRTPTVREAAEAWEALFRAQVAIMRRLARDPAFGSLDIKEYDVLFTLSKCPAGGLRLNELNDHVLLAQSSLSRLVERLVKQGLVAREAAPGDGRGVVVRLTAEGERVQREIGRAHVREIARIFGDALTPGELSELQDLSTRLRSRVVENHPL
ncbi:MarR family winged helix-turn-helix transcriptional regulator [Sinomonas sp. B1-1]|uniref:MarR family winged helix-turn-helix transcriptional regulator n=1 Tax=Sinomonas sp. B1-1 TaxID=3141454 RepID=UPI003D2A1322